LLSVFCTVTVPIFINVRDASYFVVESDSPSFLLWSQAMTVSFHKLQALLLMFAVTGTLLMNVPAFAALVGEEGHDKGRPDDGIETFKMPASQFIGKLPVAPPAAQPGLLVECSKRPTA
jgi:hypothetical protein